MAKKKPEPEDREEDRAEPEPPPADPRHLRIKNVLNVVDLDARLPEGGGIVCLEGLNGSGKSNALRAATALLDGDGRLPPRVEGAEAFVEGLGVRCDIGRRRRRGYHDDLVVRPIDDQEDPLKIVEPGIADERAADAERIRRLARLLRLAPDVGPFLKLFERNPAAAKAAQAELDAILPTNLQAADDLPALAGRIKRAAEEAARIGEGQVEVLDGLIDNVARWVEGIPLDAESDEERLRAAHDEALRALAGGERHNADAAAARSEHEAAEQAIMKAEAAGLPDPVACGRRTDILREQATDATAVRAATAERVQAARDALVRAQTALANAEGDALTAARREGQALAEVERSVADAARARMSVAAIEDLRKALGRAIPTAIPEEDMLDLQARVDEAHGAIVLGGRVRDANKRLAESRQAKAERDGVLSRVRRMRDVAAGVEGVVSEVVREAATDALVVSGGRLMVEGTPRGTVPFAELSWGERWIIIWRVLLRAVGRGGFAIVPQEAFEGLDPDNVAAASAACIDADVVILTGRPTRGPLRAVLLDRLGNPVDEPAHAGGTPMAGVAQGWLIG